MLRAQTPEKNINGVVLDENDQPVEFATVAIMSLPDSTIVTGGMTDENGAFDIRHTEENFLVQVSMIGYIRELMPSTALGQSVTIRLVPDTKMLGEVVITANRPTTEIKGDAVVTNIAGSVLEHSGNAFDVLGKIPGIIAKDDALEVIGRGAPVYYINGRKITDNNEVRNLLSEDIKSIEVVSNPGALYGGDVRCVVRIRTVKRQGEGFSFAISSQAKQHIYGCRDFEPSWSVLDLNYRTGGLDLFGKLVYYNQRNYQDSHYYVGTYVLKNGGILSNFQDGTVSNIGHFAGLQYELGANFQINDKHSIGFKIDRDHGHHAHSRLLFDADILRNDTLTDHLYAVNTTGYPRSEQWSGNLYYDGNVGSLNINFNADFVKGNEDSDTYTNEKSWFDPVEITSKTRSETNLGAGKLVLSMPIGNGTLQAGSEETYVRADQQYQITKKEIPSANAYLKENTIAGFVEYSILLPFGQVGAGLRYEHVDMKYTDLLDKANNVERHQDNWFPSLSLATKAGPVNLSLSYTGKTVRPSYHMLSNEIIYGNRFTYQCGDPTLQNEKRQTLSLNLNWEWLTFSGNYEKVENRFTQWARPYNDEGVVMIKDANLGYPIRNLGFYLNASPKIGFWYPRYTIGWQKQHLRMMVEDPRAQSGGRELTFNDPLLLIQASNAFRFDRGWVIEADYTYQSKMSIDNAQLVKPTHRLNVSVQKSFLKDESLTVRLSWQDVLNAAVMHYTSDFGSMFIHQVNDYRRPCVMLGISYRFNSTSSKYKGTGAGQDARNRM